MGKRNTTDTIVIHCTQTPPGMDVDVDKVTIVSVVFLLPII